MLFSGFVFLSRLFDLLVFDLPAYFAVNTFSFKIQAKAQSHFSLSWKISLSLSLSLLLLSSWLLNQRGESRKSACASKMMKTEQFQSSSTFRHRSPHDRRMRTPEASKEAAFQANVTSLILSGELNLSRSWNCQRKRSSLIAKLCLLHSINILISPNEQ